MSDQVTTLADRFHAAGITKAAIIDDAFDPPELTDDHRNEFIAAIEDSQECGTRLAELGFDISDTSDVDDSVVSRLWEDRDTGSALQEVCARTLFRDALQKLEDLDHLCSCLKLLGIKGEDIARLGPYDNLPSPDTPLVFWTSVSTGTRPASVMKISKRQTLQTCYRRSISLRNPRSLQSSSGGKPIRISPLLSLYPIIRRLARLMCVFAKNAMCLEVCLGSCQRVNWQIRTMSCFVWPVGGSGTRAAGLCNAL